MILKIVYDPSQQSTDVSTSPETCHRLDFVFVHGLNPINKKNHASSTWTHEDGTFWPEELLPPKIPNARVLIFEYNSNVAFDSSNASINDHADSLLDRYAALRTAPGISIIFIAHSLGGLTVKQALIRANANRAEYGHIKDSTFGLVFFGTPHRGGNGTSVGKVAARIVRSVNGSSGNEILAALEKDSVFSRESKDQFRSQLEDYKVVSFFETQKKSLKKFGVGIGKIIVDRESATLGLATIREKQIALDADHSSICRLSQDDDRFEIVGHHIASLAEDASRRQDPPVSIFLHAAVPVRQQLSTPNHQLVRFAKASELGQVACIRSLSFPNIDARKNGIQLAHPGTCDWFFATAQFSDWNNRSDVESSNGILWVKGKPGSGKSTLMRHTFRYCQKQRCNVALAGYFFHARGEALEKTPLGMFRSLILQVIQQIPRCMENFLHLYHDKERKHGKGWSWSLEELRDFLLVEVEAGLPVPLLLFIDALDECDESQVRDVAAYFDTLSSLAVKCDSILNVCLSSRHYPNISMKRRVEFVLDAAANHSDDIVLYVRDKLTINDKQVEREVLRKAAGIFMWVVLVTEILNKAFDQGRDRAVSQKLEEIPSDLDEVFWMLLAKDNHNKQETILLLQWVLFARQQLVPVELYFAVLAGTDSQSLVSRSLAKLSSELVERYITDISKGLVEIRIDGPRQSDKKVQFIHESVSDFLLRNQRLEKMDPSLRPTAIGVSHDRLKACCLSFLKAFEHTEPFLLLRSSAYWFGDYAKHNLVYHAERAEANRICQQQLFLALRSPLIHELFDQRGSLPDPGNPDDYSNEQLLYFFSTHGYPALVTNLIKLGANVNTYKGFYGNALQGSSFNGFLTVVKLLLESGADIHVRSGHTGSVLQAACFNGEVEIIKLLLENGAEVNDNGGHYGSALQAASFFGSVEVVRLLLENGADVNACGRLHGSALQAASCGGDLEVAKLLLRTGADVNARGGCYRSALQAASHTGKLEMVELLLENGADVDPPATIKSDSALIRAAAKGYVEIVTLLLEKGADVNASGVIYCTALQAASSSQQYTMCALLRQHGAR